MMHGFLVYRFQMILCFFKPHFSSLIECTVMMLFRADNGIVDVPEAAIIGNLNRPSPPGEMFAAPVHFPDSQALGT